VVKVPLKGLKIARAKGKYYVYRRSDGAVLLRGFKGERAALVKRLAEPDIIGLYNGARKRMAYPERSLGWLVAWFTDPAQCPKFASLSETTRTEYADRLGYLEPEYDFPLAGITQADLYAVRDRCVADKWPAFADKMVTALASMFGEAVKRGWMPANPAAGMDRTQKSDPNANREWMPAEWEAAMARAPLHLRTAYMLARHLGYRSQSIVAVQWSNYQADQRFGKCFRTTHKKNSEQHWLPASPELQRFLASLKVRVTEGPIALRYNGQPWVSAEQLQKQSSNFLAKLEAKGLIGSGLTLHGLRVSFAAEIKRVTGANDSQVAAALGDRDARMGAHYTRHVEQEQRIIEVFFARNGTGTEQDLENGRAQVFQISKNSKNNSKLDD
jgi:integrase